MKNVFARTVLALVLIPSFWMTSVGTAAAGWVDAPGETVGNLVGCHKTGEYFGDPKAEKYRKQCNPLEVSFPVLGYYRACRDAEAQASEQLVFAGNYGKYPGGNGRSGAYYMQFVPEYPGALAGKCYFYQPGEALGKSGDYTWRHVQD